MEQLQYIIEDKTIAYLLGANNFTNDESAILELVKNAYDAKALTVSLTFSKGSLVVQDDGIGMNASDIYDKWMHVEKVINSMILWMIKNK
ncbi:MAG: ATP-binding protein [Merdibacter sp.]